MGMKRILTPIVLAAVLAAGCGASDDAPATTVEQGASTVTTVTITGDIAYRERIALIPGGTATITLQDTSLQDVSAVDIASVEIELGDRQVPIPFALEADVDGLDARGTYTLRATIHGPDGGLDWTTDTAHVVDIANPATDLGTVLLVRATGGGEETAPSGFVGEWNITDVSGAPAIDGASAKVVFADDGTISGNTGCNSFSGAYRVEGEQLVLDGQLVSTLMACSPELNAQESAIFAVLNDVDTFQFGDDGRLTISSSDGSSITVTR